MPRIVPKILKLAGGTAFLWILALFFSFFIPRIFTPDPLLPLRWQLFESSGNLETVVSTLQEYKQAFLLDQNLFTQFFSYVRSALQGDLGTSVQNYPQPNLQILATTLLQTLPIIILLPFIWFLARIFAIHSALYGSKMTPWLGWISIPFCLAIIWLPRPHPFLLIILFLLVLTPLFANQILNLRNQGHVRFALGLGIPESKLKNLLQSSSLRIILPNLPLWFAWGIALFFVLASIWGFPNLMAVTITAHADADFSLERSSLFFLVLWIVIPSFWLHCTLPASPACSQPLLPSKWIWFDTLIFGLAGISLFKSPSVLHILPAAILGVGIQSLWGFKLPHPPMLLRIACLPLAMLLYYPNPFALGGLALILVQFCFPRQLQFSDARRNFGLLLIFLSLLQQLHS